MIFTDRKITIRNGKSTINEPVILYRGDYEVSIRFTIMESKFRFKSGVNLVDSEKASHGQLAILTPYGGNVFSEIVKCEDGTVTFTLTKEMIDQLEEVGLYSFQIRLFDYYRESRVSIPPVEFGIEVREPVASEDQNNEVGDAIVGYSIARFPISKIADGLNVDVPDTFDDNGNYNKTDWETGDRISEGRLNKIEDAIDKINQNERADVAALDKRVTSNYNVLENNKADVEYVDTKVNAVASGAPKGVYNTLSELQSAKPSGDSNIYVVSEDGCWYYWEGSSWNKGGVYQGIKLEEHSVKSEHVDGVKMLNRCTPETIVMGAYIDINYEVKQTANTAYAKIPITPNHTYVVCRYGQENQGNSMTNAVPYSITSIDGTNLVTEREGSIYSNVDNNNVRYGIFTAPANSAYLNLNVWINAVDSIDSTYCYDIDEIGTDFHDLKSYNVISRIFDIKLKDEDIRNEFEEFTNSIQVISKDIYNTNAVVKYNKYVDISGTIYSAEGWAYARVEVRPNTVYSLYFPSEEYNNIRGRIRVEDGLTNFITYLEWTNMSKPAIDNHITCTFTTPEKSHYICFTVAAGATQNYAFDDSHGTILVEGTMSSEDLIPFVERIGGKKVLNPVNLKDYVSIPTISTTWDNNKLQNGDSITYDNALYNTTPALSSAAGWAAARFSVSGGTTYYFYSPSENYDRSQRGAMVLLNENDNIIGEIPGQARDLVNIDGSNWQKIETTEETAFVGITIRRSDGAFDDTNTGVFISDYPNNDMISPIIKNIDGAKLPVGVISGISTTWDDNLFKTSGTVSGGFLYNMSGVKQAYYGWSIIDISVVGGNTYYFYSPSQDYRISTRGCIVLINSDDEIIKSIEGQGSDYYTPPGSSKTWQIIKTTSDTVKVGISITRADGAFDDIGVGVFIMEKPEKYHEEPHVTKINNLPICSEESSNSSSKPLLGVKWVVVGDSLTEKNIRATKNYHDYVSEDTGVSVVNMGVSGTGYMRRQDTNMAFYQRILNIPTDTDIVTIFGSGNDLSLPLGAPSDTGTDTICGCMHQTIQNLFSVLPGVRVGIVLPCPWGSVPPGNKGNKMQLYCEALKEIAGEYSIPVLDLYYGSNLRPWDPTFRDLYYKHDDGSSVHPDEDGHKILANKFKMFIQSL